MKLNKKGFTIVELVIVIAVIAILAAVLIPTFSSIIDKAHESADIQAVRQMNVALAAESVYEPPEGIADVIGILADAGFNSTDKLVPVSAKHGFYWSAAANMITLIRDEGENIPELIFPTDDETINTAFTAAEADWDAATDVDGDTAIFFDLEPAGEEEGLPGGGTGSGGGGSGGGSGGITTAADLKEALETGGDVRLGDNVTIGTTDQAFDIPSGTTTNLDLNGHTLTIAAPTDSNDGFENVVQGQLTITDSSNNRGTVVIESSDAVNSENLGGLWVSGGTLKLDNVNVEGYRLYNIYDYGDPGYYEFTNVTYTVYGGYGLFSNSGETTVTGCTMIANGTSVCPVYCDGSTMKITGTEFSEGDAASVSYYDNRAPIDVYDGTATLTGVTVNSSTFCVYAGAGDTVTIESGTFTGTIYCASGANVTIESGTFNGSAYTNISNADKDSCPGVFA